MRYVVVILAILACLSCEKKQAAKESLSPDEVLKVLGAEKIDKEVADFNFDKPPAPSNEEVAEALKSFPDVVKPFRVERDKFDDHISLQYKAKPTVLTALVTPRGGFLVVLHPERIASDNAMHGWNDSSFLGDSGLVSAPHWS